LDLIYKDKLVKQDVESLYDLKRVASKPIISYADTSELNLKEVEYNQVVHELNIDAIAKAEQNIIVIRGAIHDSFSYVLLKRLLNIIKNDEVNLISACIGKECTKDAYGFLIKIRPYSLKLK
jgi:DNA modification methylase